MSHRSSSVAIRGHAGAPAPLAPFPPLFNHLFPAPQRPFSPRIKRVLKSSAAPQLEDGGAAFSESAGPLRQVVPLSENALAEF